MVNNLRKDHPLRGVRLRIRRFSICRSTYFRVIVRLFRKMLKFPRGQAINLHKIVMMIKKRVGRIRTSLKATSMCRRDTSSNNTSNIRRSYAYDDSSSFYSDAISDCLEFIKMNSSSQPRVKYAPLFLDVTYNVVAMEYEESGKSSYGEVAKTHAKYHDWKKKLRSQLQINKMEITQPISGSESSDAPIISVPKEQAEKLLSKEKAKDVDEATPSLVEVEAAQTLIIKPSEVVYIPTSTTYAL
ncbi:hypothetical protein ACFE04_016126 [Oxalis oulophora]